MNDIIVPESVHAAACRNEYSDIVVSLLAMLRCGYLPV